MAKKKPKLKIVDTDSAYRRKIKPRLFGSDGKNATIVTEHGTVLIGGRDISRMFFALFAVMDQTDKQILQDMLNFDKTIKRLL